MKVVEESVISGAKATWKYIFQPKPYALINVNSKTVALALAHTSTL
jgi:hypothetical protein